MKRCNWILLWAATACLAVAAAARAESAREILDKSGVQGGLIVHLGCGDGKLTTALRANDRIMVHGFGRDRDKVKKARERVRRMGLTSRVWIAHLDGDRLPYGENMVNVLVASGTGVSREEMMRVVVPGGAACLEKDGKWERVVKPWPEAIDEWTHWLHGPDGNAVANDTVAGPPRRLKWIAGPLWSRSHDSAPSVTSMVSSGGRLFYIVDEAPASMSGSVPDKWALVARDAFNGLKLWRIPIADWGWESWATRFTVRFTIPTHMPRRLVAVGDRVYVTLGFNAPLAELDAATGEALRTFEGTEFTDEILFVDDTLVVAVNKGRQKPGPEDKDARAEEPVRKWVAALDPRSGKMRWQTGDFIGLRSKTGPMERISHLSMVADRGQVFFVDGNEIISLSLADGRELWRIPRPEVPEHKMRYNIRISDMCSLMVHNGVLYFIQLNPHKTIDWREIRGRLHAFSAEIGKEIWSRECSSWGWAHPADLFAMNGLVWVSGFKDDAYLGLDPKTGEVRRKVSNLKAFDNAHHHRCYRNKATPNYVVTSFRGLEFIGLNSKETNRNHWVRGTCRLGVLPCNGMVYATPHPCDCYITSKLNGFLALAPARAGGPTMENRTPSDRRLEKGSAFLDMQKLSAGIRPSSSRDWPTYRHDAERSGSCSGAVPLPLAPVWQVELGDTLSSPVVAGGRVFLARKNSREIVALRAADGVEQWRYMAGGVIDTPPTVYRGRAIFGAADGRVYCLRASDGVLVWRFMAAPAERWVGAFGRVESAWPVHGSVLVKDGTAYFTAGRSSFLDGGIHAWALDVATGDVVAREQLAGEQDMDVDWGRDQSFETGLLSDLLVSHDDGVYLRQHRLFSKGKKEGIAAHLHATCGLLDDSWFHRTRWFLGGAPFAEYLVFNTDTVCGVRARKRIGGYGLHFTPGAGGFELFAADPATPPPAATKPKAVKVPDVRKRRTGRPRGASQGRKVPIPKNRWTTRIPIRATAMALAADTLLVAGSPDEMVEGDPWAAYEGRKGGKLLAASLADGSIKARLDLPAPPVLDGMAVAGGRVFLSLRNGEVMCLGRPQQDRE